MPGPAPAFKCNYYPYTTGGSSLAFQDRRSELWVFDHTENTCGVISIVTLEVLWNMSV